MVKVFISWSGDQSKAVATALRAWLPDVIQEVEPFFSPEISKGAGWLTEINVALDGTSQGIVCVTRDNTSAPWLNYEAGAISKGTQGRVRTALLGIDPSDFRGPLTHFQATRLDDRDDVFKLVESINDACTSPRTHEQLARAFEQWWPELEKQLQAAAGLVVKEEPHRSDSDMLEEVLLTVRNTDLRLAELTERENRRQHAVLFPRGTRVMWDGKGVTWGGVVVEAEDQLRLVRDAHGTQRTLNVKDLRPWASETDSERLKRQLRWEKLQADAELDAQYDELTIDDEEHH